MLESLYPFSSVLVFNDTESPESKALNWLVNEDKLHLCPDSAGLVQRFVLADLYHQLAGDTWTECTIQECTDFPFLSDVSECMWEGVVCTNEIVRELHLNGRNLNGQLSEVIGSLVSLEVLAMDDNQLSGRIPEAFGSLSGLKVVDLDNNLLTGSIPEKLYNASTIQVIDLDTNQLSGTISTRIGELADLYYLQLDKNNLGGEIPDELASLEYLKYLSLFRNNFNSSIPTGLCDDDVQVYADCDVCAQEGCCQACLL